MQYGFSTFTKTVLEDAGVTNKGQQDLLCRMRASGGILKEPKHPLNRDLIGQSENSDQTKNITLHNTSVNNVGNPYRDPRG